MTSVISNLSKQDTRPKYWSLAFWRITFPLKRIIKVIHKGASFTPRLKYRANTLSKIP